MITNEVQHQATKAHAARFQEALRNLETGNTTSGDKRRRLEIAAVRSQLGDLEAELTDYEQLRSGTIRSFEAKSLPELAIALVKARIAKGWSQRRLAEQQIQRHESTGYASASLARLCDVVTALGVDVHEVVSLPSTDAAH